ncbi:MAG TPA: glycosyltransferase family 1 protein [Blastocatellia bacterium]|nr:glycosyltransferase family 1 protein [Blastocatellia bacterium]
MRLGIDASNIRDGGGLGHVSGLLHGAEPQRHGITKIIVWGGRTTLDRLPERPWLEHRHDPLLDKSLPFRTYWQARVLPRLAQENCDCLFVPGGVFRGNFRPVVVQSQNMLPFEWVELRRYGFSALAAKLLLLRFAQRRSFRRADGAIFLTNYSRSVVQQVTGIAGDFPLIPYGLSRTFFRPPRPQKPLSEYSLDHPFKLLYVSKLEPYKHQWQVVEAIAQLRREGLPVTLNLVGAPERPALHQRLQETMRRVDADGQFIHYAGHVGFEELVQIYHQADGFIFASSCENLPNIMLEAMGAGLPIACAERGPMPEALGDAGLYFDPEQPTSIATAVRALVQDQHWREQAAHRAYERAQTYSWERCARETLTYISEVVARSFPHNVAAASEPLSLEGLSNKA